MSVLVPDLMIYTYVQNGLYYAANNKTCDAMYHPCITKHMKGKKWDQEADRLIRSWAKLNEDSYNAAYSNEGAYLVEFLNLTKMITVNALQLVKYVHCIHYNIEIDNVHARLRPVTFQERKDVELLRAWEADIYRAIVTSSPQYNKLPYSDYEPGQYEPGPSSEWVGM